MRICNLIEASIRSFSNRAQTIANRGSPGQHLGLKVSDGEAIKSKMIICRQRGTKFHPGLNVAIARDFTLISMVDGIVTISKECRPSSKYAMFAKKERRFFRKFVNVRMLSNPCRFQLEKTLHSPVY